MIDMTEMLIIDGVRWRPEDAKARGIDTSKAEAIQVEVPPAAEFPPAESDAAGDVEQPAEGFDPTGKTVEEVLTELTRVKDDADAIARIQKLEATGKDRVTIAEWTPTS